MRISHLKNKNLVSFDVDTVYMSWVTHDDDSIRDSRYWKMKRGSELVCVGGA